jgi:hypothetical protein
MRKKRAMLLFALLCCSSVLMAQRSTSSAGASIYSASGQMSFTLGLLNHHSAGTPNSLTEGVLQAYHSIPFMVVQESQISIWPNPVIDLLYLKMAQKPVSAIPIQLCNLNGLLVGDYTFTADNIAISLQTYPSGTYVLKLLFPHQLPISYKIIKL